MKITLGTEQDLQIFQVFQPVSLHEAKVLKAGVIKFIKDGKPKIIVFFAEQQVLDDEVIGVIADVNMLARENSGVVVIAGLGVETRTKISESVVAVPVRCFDGLEYAVKFFTERKTDDIKIPELEQISGLENMAVEELQEKMRKVEAQNKEFKEMAQSRNIEDIRNGWLKLNNVRQQLVTLESILKYMGHHQKTQIEGETQWTKLAEVNGKFVEFLKNTRKY